MMFKHGDLVTAISSVSNIELAEVIIQKHCTGKLMQLHIILPGARAGQIIEATNSTVYYKLVNQENNGDDT